MLLLVFMAIIRKSSSTGQRQTYPLLRLLTVAVWSVALVGNVAWTLTKAPRAAGGDQIITHGDQSPIVTGTGGDVTIGSKQPEKAKE